MLGHRLGGLDGGTNRDLAEVLPCHIAVALRHYEGPLAVCSGPLGQRQYHSAISQWHHGINPTSESSRTGLKHDMSAKKQVCTAIKHVDNGCIQPHSWRHHRQTVYRYVGILISVAFHRYMPPTRQDRSACPRMSLLCTFPGAQSEGHGLESVLHLARKHSQVVSVSSVY